MSRTWGFWTLNKLDILGDYLPAFTKASSRKAGGVTVYLDLFAGLPEGIERGTGQLIASSVARALQTSPRFSRYYFFELPAVAHSLRRELAEQYPGRNDYVIVPGDCNETLDNVLSDLRGAGLDRAPIFTFLDPRNLGVKWTTIERLADFKRGRPNKVELWVLLFSSAIPRVLGGEGDSSVGDEQVTAFFGTDDWRKIRRGRQQQLLTGGQAREEYVSLFRWRIERVLGYRTTHSFEVKNTSGPLYHLILATDNKAGSRIMQAIYRKAARAHEAMRREARERSKTKYQEEKGTPMLFGPEELAAGSRGLDAGYVHDPPWPPYGSA